MTNEIFHIHGVNYKDGNRNILTQVSLYLCRKEIIGLVGGFSSGKSLILQILSGKEKPSAGYLFIGGQLCPWSETPKLNAKLIGKDIGLIATLTIWENMLLVRKQTGFHQLSFHPGQQTANIASFFEKYAIHLDPSIYVEELFNYQKLIVSVLLAVYCGYQTIFLDDFDYEYSPQERNEINRLLRQLANDGVSFVLSSLSSVSVEDLCDRMVFVSEGCTFYSIGHLDQDFSDLQIANLREILFKGGSYRIDGRKKAALGRRFFSFEGQSFSAFYGEYIGIIDPGRERIERMFLNGVTYQTDPGKKNRWFENDLLMVDVPELGHIVEWMSPAENICLGLFPRLSSGGVIPPKRLSFIGKQFAQWRNAPELAQRRDCRGLSRVDAIALSIYRIKLAKPKMIFFKSLFVGTDVYVRELLMQVFIELLNQGTTICACIASDYFEDFADRYIVLQNNGSFSDLSYEQAHAIVCESTGSTGD